MLPILMALGIGAAGCAEDPSYFLRWEIASIDGDGKPQEPDTARICSDVGLGQLRLSTYDAGTVVLADQRVVPCASPEFPDDPHPGPELEEGEYDVVLEALRDTGEVWEREFCNASQIPALWDPQVPTDKGDPDDEDGTLRCSYRDVTLSCFDPGSSCAPGSFGCDCRTDEQQEGDPEDPDDDEPACDGGGVCSEGTCGPPDCEGAAGCDCRDPGQDPVCDEGTTCQGGVCVAVDDGLCGDVQSYCPLEPTRPHVVRRWYCPFAWDQDAVTITEADDKPVLDDFVLVAPPQCDDGVDNDADGLTDLGDPACLADPLLGHEIDDRAVSSISVSVSYLAANPNVNCAGIGIGRVHLELVALGEGAGEPELIGDVACNAPLTTFPSVSRALPEGDYVLRVTGIASGTEDVPATAPIESPEPFHVDPEIGTFQKTTFDIDTDDFLEPLQSPISVYFQYQSTPEDTRGCQPSGPGGQLVVDRVQFMLYEGDGQTWTPVADPQASLMFDLDDLNPVVMGSTIEIDCPLANIAGQSVPWGHYAVSAAALAGGNACFEHPPMQLYRLAPGDDANRVTLPRVLAGDPKLPPAQCVDCQTDGDCAATAACSDGVCVSP